jgi:hypothetical protein
MWRKILRVVGALIGWGAVFAYIYYASNLTTAHRQQQKVSEVVILMSDSTETEQFASSGDIYRQLKSAGLKMKGEVVDSVDVTTIINRILRNGFVRDVDAYVTYSGKMYIDVKQHKPVARLMCGGANSYITEKGEIFCAPRGSAYYVSVVTGGYKPLFSPTYEGDIAVHYLSAVEKEDEHLALLGEEFSALKKERSECRRERDKLNEEKKKGIFESKESYEHRLVGVNQDIAKCDRKFAELNSRRKTLNARKAKIEQRKKKLQKKYDDFANLINFVTRVSEDSFWGSEVVQFVADTTLVGEISLRLVPRSGNFIIEFGTLETAQEKLEKLQEFYDEGLSRMGWNRYKIVDVRYKKQVVCTE